MNNIKFYESIFSAWMNEAAVSQSSIVPEGYQIQSPQERKAERKKISHFCRESYSRIKNANLSK